MQLDGGLKLAKKVGEIKITKVDATDTPLVSSVTSIAEKEMQEVKKILRCELRTCRHNKGNTKKAETANGVLYQKNNHSGDFTMFNHRPSQRNSTKLQKLIEKITGQKLNMVEQVITYQHQGKSPCSLASFDSKINGTEVFFDLA